MPFVDTNILLYAVSTVPGEQAKAAVALRILDSERCLLSIQVLQEFYVQATRSGRRGALLHEEAVTFIQSLLRFEVQENTMTVFQGALMLRDRHQISFWDASILAAAQTLGADTLFSEDLNHGQMYGALRVVNPFL